MQVNVSFPSGFTVAGVLVAGTNTELRIAMQDWGDIAVFHAAGEDWFAENGDRVCIRPHAAMSKPELEFFGIFVGRSERHDAAIPAPLNLRVSNFIN